MTSLFNMETLKSGAILAVAYHILTVVGVETELARLVRGVTGSVFTVKDIDVPRAIGITAVAMGADLIRNLVLSSGAI
jgi:hypothetical protein